jgi:hypothetical protein
LLDGQTARQSRLAALVSLVGRSRRFFFFFLAFTPSCSADVPSLEGFFGYTVRSYPTSTWKIRKTLFAHKHLAGASGVMKFSSNPGRSSALVMNVDGVYMCSTARPLAPCTFSRQNGQNSLTCHELGRPCRRAGMRSPGKSDNSLFLFLSV